jgi:hypothetical protein
MMRWTAMRKRYVVALWHAGYVKQVGKILSENNISADEFGFWLARFEEFGISGLHTTKLQMVVH